NHIRGLRDHGTFNASAGNGTVKIAIGVNHQMAADRSWRRPPSFDHGGYRHLPAIEHPALGNHQRIDLVVRGHSVHGDLPSCKERVWALAGLQFKSLADTG